MEQGYSVAHDVYYTISFCVNLFCQNERVMTVQFMYYISCFSAHVLFFSWSKTLLAHSNLFV
uniref:Uncharacterized protein n=1 Tax=Setaria italica TaxID=4555 RepID=K4A3U2_SETIT